MKTFKFCPSCKSEDVSYDGLKEFKCNACSFTYFHNTAAAAAALLEYEGKILFIRRFREPGKGKLDLPGGFIDPNESAEDGLNRELTEELGIIIPSLDTLNSCPKSCVPCDESRETSPGLKYIGSASNIYIYKDVTYNTCDLFFYAKIDSLPTQIDKSEIAGLELMDPTKVDFNEFAFKSSEKGIELLIKYFETKG